MISRQFALARAEELWNTGAHRPHAPAWEQLGETTKELWIQRAIKESEAEDQEGEDE